jgi:CBS domain containing-hemolysin-like protein
MSADGSKKAARVLEMVESYDKLLSAILVGNNIVNIVLASLSTVLFTSLITSSESLAVTLSTIITTVVVLLFSEISPKSIAKENPEKFAMALSGMLKAVITVMTPINAVFLLWKKLLMKIFKPAKSASITEGELITIVETAEVEGEINENESRLIRSAIEFDDSDIGDIMIPRVNVIAVEEGTTIAEVAKAFKENGFSRMPVYSKSIDSITGIIHEKDFYSFCIGEKKSIKDIMQSSVCVSESMKISDVLRLMQKTRLHMAVVVDEFGGTAGIVTLEDIIEELVGEIWDEHDEEEILLRAIGDDMFIVAGSENLDDMFDSFGIKIKEEFDSLTVGGWVTEKLGKIPLVGENFTFENLEVTVAKANAKRVLELKVKLIREETAEDIEAEERADAEREAERNAEAAEIDNEPL